MNSPVLQLQALAEDPKTEILAVLLKAKSIAVKLNLLELITWVEHEINGYPNKSDVPEYRTGHGIVKGFNYAQGRYLPLDLNGMTAEMVDMITTYTLYESISSMDKQDNKGEMVRLPLNPRQVEILLGAGKGGMELCWFFSSNKLEHIVTTVRNKILDWSLELEKQNIFGEDLRFNQQEKEVAPVTVKYIFNDVFTNNGVFAHQVEGDVNQQNTITSGDFSSLAEYLEKLGVEKSDIRELQEIISDSPVPESSENLGAGIGGWVGNMIGKAYAGGLNIAGAAAPAILTNAICHFFNIPV